MLKINLFVTLLLTAFLGFGPRAWSQCSISPVGSTSQTVCQGTAITPLSFSSSGGTGAIFSGLPAGVSGSYNSLNGEITLSGTPSVAGTFSYTINMVGCSGGGSATASGSLIVTSFNTLTFVSAASTANQVFCSGTSMDSVRIRITGTTTFTTSGLPDGVTAIRRNDTIILGGTPLNGTPFLPSANDTLFTYTIDLTGGCTGGTNSISGTLRVRNNSAISLQAGSNNAQTVCIGSAISSIVYKTGRANQVIFSGLPAGVSGSFDSLNRLVTLSGTPTVRGTYAYSVLVNGGCIGNPNVATGTITVQGYTVALQPTSAPINQTVCLGGTIQAITYTTSGATGIGTATGLPSGLTASWAANVLTVSGTVAASVAPGTFNFSVPMSGLTGCPGVNASGSIVVTGNRTVGAASSTPVLCIGSALDPAGITHATTIATGIGLPTGLPAGCTAVFSGNATSGTVTISGTPSAIGVYNYNIPMVGCGTANATGTITVQGYTVALRPISAPSSQTVCLGGTIQAISYSTSGATGIGSATGLPTGLTASWVGNVLTVSGTVSSTATPGTYNFSVPMSGLPSCPNVNATGSIVVTGNRTVGAASSTPTICIGSSLPADITHATTIATGIGLPTGLPAGCTAVFSGNATSGTVTITGTPTSIGVYNYTIPMVGCGNANATGTITVQGYTVALRPTSAPSSQTVCLGGTIQAISYATTGATGIGTATGLPTGLTATWAANVLTVSGTVAASVTPDTYNFSVPMDGLTGCPGVNATGSIVVTGNRTVGAASSTPTICIGSSLPADITHATTIATGIGLPTGLPAGCTAVFSGNATSGTVTISGTPSAIGVYNYTIPMVGCGTANATGTITVQGYTVALRPTSAPSSQTVCLGGTIQAISYSTSGATGIGAVTGLPTGLTATWAANVLTVSGTVAASVTPDTYNFSVPMDGLTGCPGVNATGSIVVTGNRTVGAASSTPTICIGSSLPADITHATTIATGIGLPTGLPAGCTAVFSGNATSGTVTITGTPTSIGVFNYTIPMVGCGNANATGTITVQGYTVALRPISAPSSQTVCLGGTIQAISYATTGATGIGTATGLPTGLTASWVSNVLTVSGTVDAGVTPGTFNFSVPMSGLTGCPGVNATGSIVVRPYNSISLTSGNGSPSLCLGDLITPIVYTTSGFSNGIVVTGLPQGITHSYDSASRITTISGTPSVRGVFVYRITALGGCTQNSSNTITGTITVNGNTILLGKKDPNLSTPDVVTNIQTRCALRPIQSVVFTTTGATGASLVPALPANSGLTANFNSGTGVFTISGTPSGSFTYIGVVRMSGGCTSGQIEPSVNITVLDSNIITLTSGSENQTVPRNTAMTDITFSTAGATGARFRGLPSGVTGIWAANTVTISGTPVATGTYRYIVDMVGGCPVGKGNSDTGTITVTAGGSLIGGGNGEQGFEGDDANRSNQNNASAISSGRLNSNRGLITTVTVYPVPGSDFLFVRGLASLEQTLLTIVDQTGRVVVAPHASISNDSGSSEYKLDLSSLADGVYFLRVQSATEGIDQMLRFSVKH